MATTWQECELTLCGVPLGNPGGRVKRLADQTINRFLGYRARIAQNPTEEQGNNETKA
jgi:hypothetical protein